MNNVLGIIFSNMHEQSVSELTVNRCMGSIPMGGRYRLIDFPLSNLANSGVEQVGVVTKSNYQSLMDHLGSGRPWDLSRKNRGLSILPPFGNAAAGMYRGRVEALAGIMGYIQHSGATEVLAADCDVMANMDYTGFLRAHRESGAEITVMYKKVDMPEGGARECSVFRLGDDGSVQDMLINPQLPGRQNVYLNIFIANREFLERTVAECHSRGKTSFDKDVLQAGIGRHKIYSYEFDGYISRFNSMHSYYQANMALLDTGVRAALFPRQRPVYTKIRDEAPVRYGLESTVTNSLLADGCVIEGEVENSVLFRGVRVGKDAKVKNCILMQSTQVGARSSLECVISDKDVIIRDERVIVGFNTYPVYIAKGSSV